MMFKNPTIQQLKNDKELEKIINDLLIFTDNFTPKYKIFIEKIKPCTRRSFVTLLTFSKPVTAKEIAKLSRQDVHSVSAYLGRLAKKGWVKKIDTKRPFYYEAIDPFNKTILNRPAIEIYFKIRNSGLNCRQEAKNILSEYSMNLLENSIKSI